MSSRTQNLEPEKVVALRQLMADGMSVQEVADAHKLSYFTVYQIRRGWTYRSVGGPILARQRGQLTPEMAAKIRALRKKGASIDQLVRAAKVGRTTIKKALSGVI